MKSMAKQQKKKQYKEHIHRFKYPWEYYGCEFCNENVLEKSAQLGGIDRSTEWNENYDGTFAWCTAPRANAHFPNIADRNVKRKKLNRKDVLAFWNVNLMPQKNRICLMYLFVCLSFSFVDALTAYMQLHSRVRTIYFTQAHRYISCHIDILRV